MGSSKGVLSSLPEDDGEFSNNGLPQIVATDTMQQIILGKG